HMLEYINIYNNRKEKVIPNVFLNGTASYEVLRGLFEGLIESDGNVKNNSICFDSTSKDLINQMQHLCLMIGLSANVGYTLTPQQRGSYSENGKDLTRLHIISKNLCPQLNYTFWVNNWKGNIYCAEVKNNTLYVRRNGIPVWSGNSVLEHAQVSFGIVGVARVFTHELARHRSGCAISQESLRFVRLTDIDVVLSPEIPLRFLADEKAELVMEEMMDYVEKGEELQKKMSDIFGLDNRTDFGEKKIITSWMRRIAPIGLATHLVWSCNLRALRHILEMRTSVHAEEEIRKVFDQIGFIVKKKFPSVFQDFERSSNGEWVTENSKI
ncbi:MAG: FAD-dependent thymidylate synthase, partial [Thermodesulfobacteriota bacterium]